MEPFLFMVMAVLLLITAVLSFFVGVYWARLPFKNIMHDVLSDKNEIKKYLFFQVVSSGGRIISISRSSHCL